MLTISPLEKLNPAAQNKLSTGLSHSQVKTFPTNLGIENCSSSFLNSEAH
jgi:hypothetical protein